MGWRDCEGLSSGPDGRDSAFGDGERAASSGGDGVAGSGDFSSEVDGNGDAVSDRGRSHCLAIFFSTRSMRSKISNAMSPNAIAKTA